MGLQMELEKKDTFDGHTDSGEISQAKCGKGVGRVSWLPADAGHNRRLVVPQ